MSHERCHIRFLHDASSAHLKNACDRVESKSCTVSIDLNIDDFTSEMHEMSLNSSSGLFTITNANVRDQFLVECVSALMDE